MPKAPQPVKRPGQGRHWTLRMESPASSLAPCCFSMAAPTAPHTGHCSLHGLAQRSCIPGKGCLHLGLSAELGLEFAGECLCQAFTQHPSAKPTFPSLLTSLEVRDVKHDPARTCGSHLPVLQSCPYGQKQYPDCHSLFLLLSIKTLLICHCRPLGVLNLLSDQDLWASFEILPLGSIIAIPF